MTLREVDTVNVAFFKFCLNRKTFEQQLRNVGVSARRRSSTVAWWVDITQSVERAPMGALPPSVHTHSVIYFFEQRVVQWRQARHAHGVANFGPRLDGDLFRRQNKSYRRRITHPDNRTRLLLDLRFSKGALVEQQEHP